MNDLAPFSGQIESATSGRKHFSTQRLGLQIAWDSTSLGDFKTCPRKYYYTHILGLRSRREATPLTFGIHYHHGLETYDRVRFQGMSHRDALHYVVRDLASQMGKRTPAGVEMDEEGNVLRSIPATWQPWTNDDTKRNYYTCLRSVVWYLDQFGEADNLQTVALANGKPAVELSFRMEIPQYTPPGHTDPYLICGHLDRVASWSDMGVYVVDRKTSGSALNQNFFDNYSPDNQMSLYTFAAKVVYKVPVMGVIIDGAQIAVGFTRFQRGFVNRTQAQIDEWVKDLGYWFELAERYAAAGHWPHNDKSCGMFGGCVYRSVCSRDPAVRHHFLAGGFTVNPWNPLQPRGE